MSRFSRAVDRIRPLAAEPPILELLNEGQDYLELVKRIEADPENCSGADKSWVERAMWEYQQHYRRATRS